MIRTLLIFFFVLPAIVFNFFLAVPAQELTARKDIYHTGWIDLNKNGRMDIYENPKIDIETRIGIPVDFTNEGLRGVAVPVATSFPSQLGMGHTWDKELVREMGRITGSEGRALGYTNIYALTLDVARDQCWGRLEDVYGEDPYLVSRLGVEIVRGLQENNTVAATAKHFAIYSVGKGAREG